MFIFAPPMSVGSTGHSYVAYGVLSNGGTSFIYEGVPNFPEPDRYWRMIDRCQDQYFYTAPTAIRSFIKWGDDWLTSGTISPRRACSARLRR